MSDNKGDARDSRLSMRKNNEEVFRKKLQLEAQAICREETIKFGECAKRHGMFVVFNCRSENSAMSDCLDRHSTEKDFERLLIREGADPATLKQNKK